MMTESRMESLQVTMTWGGDVQCTELYSSPMPIVVGDARGAAFSLPPEVVPEPFNLLEAGDEGWVLCIPAGAPARAEQADADGNVHALDLAGVPSDASGTRRVRLGRGSRGHVEVGAFTFHVKDTATPEKIGGAMAVDWRPWRWVGASALFHGALILTFMMSPPDATALSFDISRSNREYIEVHLSALETREQPLDDGLLADGAASSEGRPMQGDEGAAGAVDERRHTGGGVAARGDDEQRAVPLTREAVRQMNVFGVLAAAAGDLSSVSSPLGDASAHDFAREALYGPLMAAAAGFGPGSGGFGMVGTGRGGCPVGATDCAAGTVGSGDFDTIGTTGGCSREDFERFMRRYGRAGAMDRCSGTSRTVSNHTGLHRTGRVPNRVRIGTAEPSGALSREQIRRVVRRNVVQIRHCYEQQLQSQPDLAGRVSVQFIIASTGAVSSSQLVASDLGSASVEECIAHAVRRWPFPSSEGITSVTYPFVLQTQ